MAKTRDYIYMDVVDIKGKKMGYIKDILINFNQRKIVGFKVEPYKIIGKGFNILKEHIIYYNKEVVIDNYIKDNYLEFSSIKNMYVYDISSNFLGSVYELIFDEQNYDIIALCLKFSNIFIGFKERKIVLVKDLILGEKNIIYINSSKCIEFNCSPKFSMGFDFKEKIVE